MSALYDQTKTKQQHADGIKSVCFLWNQDKLTNMVLLALVIFWSGSNDNSCESSNRG